MFDKGLTPEVLKMELGQYIKSSQGTAGLRFGQYILNKYLSRDNRSDPEIFYIEDSSEAYNQILKKIS